jgi:capsular polysaccharide biosynthesis protein
MNNGGILPLIRGKITGIIIFGFFVAALSFLALVAKEKNFKVTTDFLIVQNQTQNEDFYTLSKSAEYTGRILNEGIYSELFIDEVIKSGKVNAEFLPFDKKEKMKQWSKNVQVNRNPDLGILSVEVFDNNQKQSLAISDAIGDVLMNKNNLFLGEGQNIGVKVLSGPIAEKNPTFTNILATMAGGFVLGIMLGILYVVYNEDKRRKNIFAPARMQTNYGTMNSGAMNRMEAGGNSLSEEEYQQILKYAQR